MIKQFSNAGEHHCFDNATNQDAIAVAKDSRYIAFTLADGVSTCSEAKTGAHIAAETLNKLLKNKASFFFGFAPKEIADIAMAAVLYELKKQAVKDNIRIEEYSSTICSVLVDTKRKKAILINLGDGIIIGTSAEKVKILALPDDSIYGCCVTTTQNATKAIRVTKIDSNLLTSITICSDGAWKQMFNKNRLRPDIAKCLLNKDFEWLEKFLIQQNCFDDHSFVSVDLEAKDRRKSA